MQAAVVAAQQQQQQQQQNQAPSHPFMSQKAPQQNIGTVQPQPHQGSNSSLGSGGWASTHFMYGDQQQQNNPLGGGLGQSTTSPYQANVFNPMANSFGAPTGQSSFNSFNFNPLMGMQPRGQQANHSHAFMQAAAQSQQAHPQHSNYGHMMGSNPLQSAMNSTSFHSPQHPGQHPFDLNLAAPFGAAQGHPGGKAMSPQSHHPPDYKPDYSALYGFNDASAFNQAAAAAGNFHQKESFRNQQFLQASSSFNNGNGSGMQQHHLNANSGFPNSSTFQVPNKLLQSFTKQDQLQKTLGIAGPYSFPTGNSAPGAFGKTGPGSMQMNSGASAVGAQGMMQSQNPGAAFGSHAFSNANNPSGPRMPIAPIQRPNFPRPRASSNAISGMQNMFPPPSSTAQFNMNSSIPLQKRNSQDRSSPGTGQRPWSSDTGNISNMGKYAQNFMPTGVAYGNGGNGNMQRSIGPQPPYRRDAFAPPNSMTGGPRFNSNPVPSFKPEGNDAHVMMSTKPTNDSIETSIQNDKTDVSNIFAQNMVPQDVGVPSAEAPVDLGVTSAPGSELPAPSNEQNNPNGPPIQPSVGPTLQNSGVIEQNNVAAVPGSATSNAANMSIAVD